MKCSVQWAFHFSKHVVGCFVFSVIATERKKLEHVFMIIVKQSPPPQALLELGWQ
jgi:hypothetical protein